MPTRAQQSRRQADRRTAVLRLMQAVRNLSVGDRCVMVRRSGFADRPSTAELVHIDPPQVWRIREIDGPNRATVTSRSPSWPPTGSARITRNARTAELWGCSEG